MSSLSQKARKLNRLRNHKTKKIKLLLKVMANDCWFRKKSAFNPSVIKKILIVMIGKGIGDAIVMSGLLDALIRKNYQTDTLTDSRVSCIFENFPHSRNYIISNKNNHHYIIKEIKKSQYDLIIEIDDIDIHSPLRVKLIKSCSAFHTLGFNQFSRVYDTIIYHRKKDRHISDRHIMVGQLLGVEMENYQYCIIPSATHRNDTEDFIRKKALRNFIVINPYATEDSRNMSTLQIDEICNFCVDKLNKTPLLVGVQERIKNIPDKPNHIKFTLPHFQHVISVIKMADLIVSPDTSIVHLSRAFNKKLICIYNNKKNQYGEDNNILWGPNYHRALQIISPGKNVADTPVETITSAILQLS